MKIILSSRIHHYVEKVGIFLIMAALIVGMPGCEPAGCAGGQGANPPGTQVRFNLTVAPNPVAGGTAADLTNASPYAAGTVVSIQAVAAAGYQFVNWSATTSTFGNATAANTTFTMPAQAVTVTANFIAQYDLTIDSTGGGEVITPGQGTSPYDAGTVVDLVAVADECYEFVNWTGDTVADPNSATTTITMDGAKNVIANFALLSYDLTADSTDGGDVTAPGEGASIYDCGTVVDLVATPASGYYFVNWSGNVGTIANVTAASTTITMNGAYTITANFIAQYDLTINSTDGGEVITPSEGTHTYDAGTVVDLVAEAEESYHFVQWSGNVSAIANVSAASTTITMNGAYNITANFILFAGGNGTAEDPYQIADWRHLDNVRNYLNHHFIVINDLDSNSAGYEELASPTANEGKGWQPIGINVVGAKFAGSFDGQEHEICDLFIDRPDEPDVGLFGVVDTVGVIENVGVVNDNVTGYDNVAGLVGKNEGTVSDSYSTGNVTGNANVGGLVGYNFFGAITNSYSTGSVTGNYTGSYNVGGLVGWNRGTMSNSYSTGSVTGDDVVGGLAGKNSGTASNSYATGSVTGDDNVGGLVGRNDATGTVSNSYSTGSVTGNTHVGGLVGRNFGTVSNSFWDTQTSGRGTSDGGTAKTTAQMKDIDTFSGAGWNIIAVANSSTRNTGYIWNIVDDVTYPFLSWQPV